MTKVVTATVVFTDLVGSTELAARLGPGAAEDLRTRHFGLLRDAVSASGGREVKNLGDGLMVVYPSLTGALDGAIAMQQRIDGHNRTAIEPLRVRIGVSSGDAVEEDGDYFGEPVVEAARLCAKAAGGQIVTTALVRLVAERTGHRFASMGSLELKGLPEPVDAYELRWDAVGLAAPVPLPRRLALTPDAGVVGRDLERGRLLDALKAASAGAGHRVVLMSGEPGIGKTTLAGDVGKWAFEGGATVLYGRCDEDIGVPYQPFVEALGGYVSEMPGSPLAAFDERLLSELSRLLPQVRIRCPSIPEARATDAEAERYLLFGSVNAALVEIAARAPVVLVLDDLHWADKPTIQLLRHLVANLHRAAVFIVGTYRDSDLTVNHPLTEGLAAFHREPAVERMTVGGLDDGGVVALLEGLAGHEMDDDGVELARVVRLETGGNPFFTSEVLRHLADTGAIREEDGRWVPAVRLSSITLPDSVREIVGQRVLRLGEDAQRLLATASVLGRDFDLGLLARVADRHEDTVLDALEAAAAALLIAEVEGRPERFTFTHALVQHTLYDSLSATGRARAHRRVGELLETELGDDPGDRVSELAHHWVEATKPSDVGKAAGYARQAGERALGALAPDEAIRWFRQAIELLDAEPPGDPLPRLDILIGLGDAQRQSGDPQYRETLLAAATEAARLGTTDRLVAAALTNQRGMVSSMGAVDSERIAVLELALEAVDDGDSRDRAWLLATLVAELQFSDDIGRLRRLAIEAESMARRLGDDGALLRVLNLTFIPLWWPDAFARMLAASQEALDLAAQVDDPVARFWAAMNRGMAMASSIDKGGIDAALELAASLAQEIGQPFLAGAVRQAQCAQMLLAGDADEADRRGMEALQIGMDSGQPDAFMMFGANLLGVRMHQGRLDEIIPVIAQAAADNPGLPGFQAALAVMLCECERLDEARPLLEGARAVGFHHISDQAISLMTTSLWAEAAVWLEDRSAAEILYQRLAPFEDQGVVAAGTFSGTVAMYLARTAALLGREYAAARHFERADHQLRALGAPFWRARNQIDWARLLQGLGTDADRRHARALLAEALAAADQHGCDGIKRRAQELGLSPL